MTVLLSSQRGYGASPAGAVITLHPSTEAALITQGLATNSVAAITTGAQSSNEFSGRCAFAAAATSLVVTNPNVQPQTKINAIINQATADTTFTFVARVVPAAGSFTIFANAAATAATVVDWYIVLDSGETPNQ
jgi:hypothetical protein